MRTKLRKAIHDLVRALKMSDIWVFQAYHEISAKYQRTVLGGLWIAGSMVITSLSFAIVFGALFQQDIPTTLPYVMAGIMAFYFIGYIFSDAPEVFLSNSGIITNNAFPFSYYSLEGVTKNFIIFLHNILVFEVITLLLGKAVLPNWTILFGIPVVLFNMFTWGTVVSMLSARFRDIRYLLPYLAGLIMFLTPIIYRASDLKGKTYLFVEFNPVYPFVEMIRSPLLGYKMEPQLWIMAGIVSFLGIIVWILSFGINRRKIVFWI